MPPASNSGASSLRSLRGSHRAPLPLRSPSIARPSPSRSYVSAPPPPPPSSKARRRLTRLGVGLAVGGGAWAYDEHFQAAAGLRTIRTGVFGALMAADFKLNFNPANSSSIDALHERVADRIHHLCVTNGGLYIKIGQSLAVQAAVLPKPYQRAFGTIFDGAPGVSFDEVVKVFRKEFGVHPDEAFDEFAREPVASASIAQVHRARLKRKEGEGEWKDGEGWVAVKIRKPSVPLQIDFDLFAYKALLWTYEKMFDLPVSFVADYVALHMRKEVDLANEAHNAERSAAYLANEPSLRDNVVIPKVYWDWTGTSVMTAEFVEACKLTDKVRLTEQGLSFRQTMDTATSLFAAQTFKWGWVHADPHPGNVLVRPHPNHPNRPQIILIDHGLYIPLSDTFRQEYCLLWRSLFVADIATIEKIAKGWGIAQENSDMFASMTLLRPHHLRKKKESEKPKAQTTYEAQTGLKERFRSMLQNEQLIPRELIFLTRSMRMMQANNQALGSPSNRINALAHWAAAGLDLHVPISTRTFQTLGFRSYFADKAQSFFFRFTLLLIDVGFALTQVRQWALARMGTTTGEGFEDILQRQVKDMARDEFGIELGDAAFSG